MPGTIPANKREDVFVNGADFHATFLSAAHGALSRRGARVAAAAAVVGSGRPGRAGRQALRWRRPLAHADGRQQLATTDRPRARRCLGHARGHGIVRTEGLKYIDFLKVKSQRTKPALYNLTRDLHERNDISERLGEALPRLQGLVVRSAAAPPRDYSKGDCVQEGGSCEGSATPYAPFPHMPWRARRRRATEGASARGALETRRDDSRRFRRGRHSRFVPIAALLACKRRAVGELHWYPSHSVRDGAPCAPWEPPYPPVEQGSQPQPVHEAEPRRRAHLTKIAMGNAPPEGLKPKDDAEAAQWAAEDAQAMRMPRYVPVASLGNYERPTMQQIRNMFLYAPGGRGYFGLPRVDASYDVDLLGGGGGARFITADVETSVKQLKALISAAPLHGRLRRDACGRARRRSRASRRLSNAQLMAAPRATAAGGPRRHLPRRQASAKLVRDGAFTVGGSMPAHRRSCLERTLFVVGGTKRAHGAMHGEVSMLASGRWLKCCAVPERVRGRAPWPTASSTRSRATTVTQ